MQVLDGSSNNWSFRHTIVDGNESDNAVQSKSNVYHTKQFMKLFEIFISKTIFKMKRE